MPGKRITRQQEKLYMSYREQGLSQTTAAAKAGFSERTARNVDNNQKPKMKKRDWKTRQDPFADVWESELKPMLENQPELAPITLLEYLQNKYPKQYPDKLLRTLQRRKKQWAALSGPEKEVIFRQEQTPGRQGFSDFTQLKEVTITIAAQPFEHLLYHFRLAYSGWSYMKVILGGESFTALAEGLQEALWRLGAAPLEHRTDSLSAAFKNLCADQKKDTTRRYHELCRHYNLIPTRNNRGKSHENGSIESPHGHIKQRIKQGLLLRNSTDFDSIEAYQRWLDEVICAHNNRNAKSLAVERPHLQKLPTYKGADYTEVLVRVSSSSTIEVRRCTYSVPSRLIAQTLRILLYHDRLVCHLGASPVVTLERVYAQNKNKRAKKIDYRHIIHSLIKKPGAFRFSQHRNEFLPNNTYRTIWEETEKHLGGRASCKFIVGLLFIAANFDCETVLGEAVIADIECGKSLNLTYYQHRFGKPLELPPDIDVRQHSLQTYDTLLAGNSLAEVNHGY